MVSARDGVTKAPSETQQPCSDDDQLVVILAAPEVIELVSERIPAVFTLPVSQRWGSRLNKAPRLVLRGGAKPVAIDK